jgi:integron integrase
MLSQARPPGLIQRYREELQVRHYARRTVSSYEQWLRRFLRFHRMRHPRTMGEAEINAFLSHLATEEGVSASTQNQALAALLFLYRTVLGGDVGNLEGVIRARKRQRLPVVLTVGEVRAVLRHLDGAEALVAQLLYGGGLRLMEALRLRIKDVDLEQHCITVRCGKGDKDRRTVLPASLVETLKGHMQGVRRVHQADLAVGWGAVELPHALERKYRKLAMAVSPGPTLAGSTTEHRGKAPSRSEPCAARHACSRAGSGDQQTGDLPHLPPFVRHAPSGTGSRHPYDSGTTRP